MCMGSVLGSCCQIVMVDASFVSASKWREAGHCFKCCQCPDIVIQFSPDNISIAEAST